MDYYYITILYSIILRCIIFINYYTILFSVTLSYIILHFIVVLFYTILFYVIIYFLLRPNIYYEVRLKGPPLREGEEEALGCMDREEETEAAAADLAEEIKTNHKDELGIVYCLKKTDCEAVRCTR